MPHMIIDEGAELISTQPPDTTESERGEHEINHPASSKAFSHRRTTSEPAMTIDDDTRDATALLTPPLEEEF